MPKNLIRRTGMAQSNTKASNIFVSLINPDFRSVEAATPHEYVQAYWDAYMADSCEKNAALNGNFFEIPEICAQKVQLLPSDDREE